MTRSNFAAPPRPLSHLQAAGKLYPDAWKGFELFRASRGIDLPDWPEWTYVPLAASYAIVSGGGNNRVPLEHIGDVARLGALAPWRYTHSIYRFDPDIYDALVSTPLRGTLPVDVLYRLPEWCVYFETPGMTFAASRLYGAFAHLEWDANSGRTELRFLLDSEAELAPVPLHIGAGGLSEAITEAARESRTHAVRHGLPAVGNIVPDLTPLLEPLVSLLLYICSDGVEYGGDSRPSRPQAKKTKRGWRLFPPAKPRFWNLGARTGQAIREAHTLGGTHAGPAPPYTPCTLAQLLEGPTRWRARTLRQVAAAHCGRHARGAAKRLGLASPLTCFTLIPVTAHGIGDLVTAASPSR